MDIRNSTYTTPIIRLSVGSIAPSAIATKKFITAKVELPTPNEVAKLNIIAKQIIINSIT